MSSSLPKFRGSAPKDLRKSYQATKNRHMPQKGWSFQQQVGVLGFLTPPTKFSQEYDQWLFQLHYYPEKRTWLFNTTLSLKIPGSQKKLKQQKREISSIDTSFPCEFFFPPDFFCVKSHVSAALWPMSPGSAKQEWNEALGWAKIVTWITTSFYWFYREDGLHKVGYWSGLGSTPFHPKTILPQFFYVSETCHTSQGITLLCYIGFLHMIWSWYFLLRVWIWCLKIVSSCKCVRRHVFERLSSKFTS